MKGRFKLANSSSLFWGRGSAGAGAFLALFATLVMALVMLLAALAGVSGGSLGSSGPARGTAGLSDRQGCAQHHGANQCEQLLHAISFKGSFSELVFETRITTKSCTN